MSILKDISRFLAGLCAIAAILTGSYMVWRVWGSGIDMAYTTHREEKAVGKTFTTSKTDKVAALRHDDPPVEPTPADDELFAYVRVPSWSKTYRLAAWEGTGKTVLDKMGAGHYAGSAMPGQPGNSVWAGHNTYADFADIRLLHPGDQVIIETAEHWYVYRVNAEPRVVDETDTRILDADAAGAERGITLQTCWPILSAQVTQRMIVTGTFEGWANKTDGTPEQLAETHDTTATRVGRRIQTVSERIDMPVSGVLALCAGTIWLVLNTFILCCTFRQWRERWTDVVDPLTWSWRLCAGLSGNHIIHTAIRIMLWLLLWFALIMLSWRCLCPWMATWMPA